MLVLFDIGLMGEQLSYMKLWLLHYGCDLPGLIREIVAMISGQQYEGAVIKAL